MTGKIFFFKSRRDCSKNIIYSYIIYGLCVFLSEVKVVTPSYLVDFSEEEIL